MSHMYRMKHIFKSLIELVLLKSSCPLQITGDLLKSLSNRLSRPPGPELDTSEEYMVSHPRVIIRKPLSSAPRVPSDRCAFLGYSPIPVCYRSEWWTYCDAEGRQKGSFGRPDRPGPVVPSRDSDQYIQDLNFLLVLSMNISGFRALVVFAHYQFFTTMHRSTFFRKILAFWEQLVTDMKKGDDNLVPRNFIVSELQFPLRTIHCSKDKLQVAFTCVPCVPCLACLYLRA